MTDGWTNGRAGSVLCTQYVTPRFLVSSHTIMNKTATVLFPFHHAQFTLDGVPRMRERPIKDLTDGLKQLGVDITCSDTGCPPVRTCMAPSLSALWW